MNTKARIIKSAIKLFNEQGFVNVRLQHIADETGISVGNLAYHFVGKEAIIYSILDKLSKEQSILLANYMAVPLFEHIDNIIEQNYRLQQEYKFFYLDTLEIFRHYKKVKSEMQKKIALQIIQVEGMFQFNQSRGAFIKKADYTELAKTFWMTGHLWMYEQSMIGEVEYNIMNYRKRLWALLFPYFTPLGKEEYKRISM